MVVDRRRTVVRYPPAKLITPLDNPDPIQGWVERSDTHQLHLMEMMGFASLNPSYVLADLPVGQFVGGGVYTPLQKYFASPVGQIISTSLRHPTPQEGRIMIVTKRGVECGGRGSVLRAMRLQGRFRPVSDHQACGREMLQRTAKSCGPDAPTLASSWRSLSRPNRA